MYEFISIVKNDKNQLKKIVPILSELYPSISPDLIEKRLYDVSIGDWECVYIVYKEEIIALSGFFIRDRICYGKFMYIDHFIVTKNYRGQLVSDHLLEFLIEKAESLRCNSVILDTFVTNSRAQKLWINNNFTITGFHFKRNL